MIRIWNPQGRLVKTPLRQDRESYDPNEFPDFRRAVATGLSTPIPSSRRLGPRITSTLKKTISPTTGNKWRRLGYWVVRRYAKTPTLDSAWVYPATRVKHPPAHARCRVTDPLSYVGLHVRRFDLDPLPSHPFFYSFDNECTEANGHLSTFLEGLLSLNDLDLGKVASPGDPDGPPLPFPTAVLPPRVPSFARHLVNVPTMGSIEIEKTVFYSGEVLGLQKSASRIRAIRDEPGDNREYAMTVSFVEEARCNEHDQIRQMIASASPHEREGLTNFVDVHRQHFILVPHFLKGDLDAEECAEKCGLKPRAMEVIFQERCFELPIGAVNLIEALTRAVLGAVKGLRRLYRMRILHRNVSPGNIMIALDGEGVLIDYETSILMDGPVQNAGRI